MFHSRFISSWILYSAINLRLLKGSGLLAKHGLDIFIGLCFPELGYVPAKKYDKETKLLLT